jgi:hypothetical protein
MFAGYPVFILFADHWFDRIAAIVMFFLVFMQIYAIFRGGDRFLIYMTRTVQVSIILLTLGKVGFSWGELLECPARSPGYKLVMPGQLNCTGQKTSDMDVYHASARGTVSAYSSVVLLPILFLLHMIPVAVVLPIVTIVACVDVYITSTYVPMSIILSGFLNPAFSGAFICIIGYRADFLALKTWQEKTLYMKQKETWLASVAHNVGVSTVVYFDFLLCSVH